MRSTIAALLLACLGAPASTLASGGRQPQALGADPDRPRIALFYRGALRGTLGLRLPLWSADDDAGPAFDLTPMIELHEPPGSDQPLPNQHWRGLISAGGDHGLAWSAGRLRAGLRLAHESDHETAHEFSSPGFLALNFVEAPAALELELGSWRLGAQLSARVYLLSCTRRAAPCRDLRGDGGLGGLVGLSLHHVDGLLLGLRPFGAVALSGIVGDGLLASERRVAARAGLFVPVPSGLLQLHALAFFGHDVGITRRDELSQLGGGIAWTLML